jgi:two-component system LytT family response regulator
MKPSAWRTLIADDERIARRGLRRLIESDPEITIVGECANGREVIDTLQTSGADLLFLDIQMPFTDGLRSLTTIESERRPLTVVVSAHQQYAIGAFEAHAFDYLLKPFSDARLLDTLSRAKRQLGLRQTPSEPAFRIGVRTERGLRIVPVSDVDWIEANDYESLLHVRGETLRIREPLASLASRLDATQFVRVHRSAIVNIARVTEVQSYFHGRHVLILSNGKKVMLSRSRRADFERVLGQPL